MIRLLTFTLALALAGCLTDPQALPDLVGRGGATTEKALPRPEPKVHPAATAPAETPAAPAPVTRPEPELPASALVAHEWGTFTSVQSSEGVDLEGLHHEEEPLPAFVHRRDTLCVQSKCVEPLGEAVTQKMETPVIYFHTDRTLDVTVKVDFPQGIVSEWYPKNVAATPAKGGTLEKVAGGSMTWKVTLNPGPTTFPAVAPGDIWQPSREVASAPLRADTEEEGFIFYRGIGRFTTPVRITSTAAGEVNMRNDSGDEVPAAFLLDVDETGGGVLALGAVGAHAAVSAPSTLSKSEMGQYVATASDLIADALEATGLTAEESLAMVRTWEVSYFHTPGLRILYVLPRSWTDAILPLTMEPAPDALVRTLVGRIEVMTPAEEADVKAMVEGAVETGQMTEISKLGRYAEAKVRRACQLVGASSKVYCEQLAQNLAMDK